MLPLLAHGYIIYIECLVRLSKDFKCLGRPVSEKSTDNAPCLSLH